MMQPPMISSPLKQTNEIDWIAPLKGYIRQTYGDDPEKYAEECTTLNRLRQDMRGAGKDSAAGRDLLYRYYGQLELLDLRFPVDENHIKVSFTWFDAFTHKPTSQYSLAFEKASIIFNISAVLSCHAAHQNRFEETGLKTAYHSFQASAGMFTYINENFLHAPSTDLSRDTVKTLIAIMLAQGQEVFLEKQVADGKKSGLLAKLASQAAYLYSQAAEGVQENVSKGIFERPWLLLVQIKANHMYSIAQYYQALTDADANAHGTAITRLTVAEGQAKDANRVASAFPSSVPAGSDLSPETGASLIEMTRRHITNVQEKLANFSKDNDFIYHQPLVSEATLPVISKLPAAKAIPVSELYQGQDIQRIIGPDIFQKIVPMSVTESASLYDEEKAKLVRAEAERVEIANGEMAASLDYLKLPGSLNILKGGMDQTPTVDDEFRRWCEELAGHESFGKAFEQIQSDKAGIITTLDKSTKQLDMEESVCEKMRSKYGADWTQQPSSRLTATLRSDIRSYRGAIDEASLSDSQLLATARQYDSDFDEMRSAGETDEADILYQRAMLKAGAGRGKGRNGVGSPMSPSAEGNLLDEDYGEGGTSVAEQIAKVEELLKKLNFVKKERTQVLKDLKEKVHTDDISNVLILNKKAISNHENQLFQAELEKFRPYQTRLLQANHKQSSLMKELTKAYSDLLQDRRVQSEQARYERFNRQRNSVLTRYRKVFQAFNDLVAGLMRAQSFYSEMRETVDSLEENVETFVNNRRSEGAQLLNHIERDKASSAGGQADRERDRLRELMERMSMDPSTSPSKPTSSNSRPGTVSTNNYQTNPYPVKSPPISPHYPPTSGMGHYTIPPSHSPPPPQSQSQQAYPQYATTANGGYHASQPSHQHQRSGSYTHTQSGPPPSDLYNPMIYPYQTPVSPPPNHQQQYYPQLSSHHQPVFSPHQQQLQGQYMPQGYIPPPPPPGPPPTSQQHHAYHNPATPYPAGPGGYAAHDPRSRGGYGGGGGGQQQQSSQQDPWAGLNAWK